MLASCNTHSPAQQPGSDSLRSITDTPGTLAAGEQGRYAKILDTFFDNQLIKKGFNGSILVAKEGNILYEKYVGFRDLRLKDSLTDTTSFHLASTSKPFTGMATLWLVQQGLLSLDDTLQKFFPNLPYHGVTVRMLLCHRSGIPNYVYFMADKKKWDDRVYVTNPAVLDYMYREQPARSFAPGTRFSYSNSNYVLLAMIIEKISGKTLPEYLRDNIFLPMKMDHTFVFTLKDTNTATHSFDARGGFWKNDFLEGTYGDKNVYSTPRDMLKWDQALYTGQFIRPSLLDSAFIPQSHETRSMHNYGLGWRLLMLPDGKKIVYHFGRWHGFTPAFARLIDQKVTIIILGNKFNRNIYNSAHKAYELFGVQMGRASENDESDTPGEKKEAEPTGNPKTDPAGKKGESMTPTKSSGAGQGKAPAKTAGVKTRKASPAGTPAKKVPAKKTRS